VSIAITRIVAQPRAARQNLEGRGGLLCPSGGKFTGDEQTTSGSGASVWSSDEV